MINGIFSRVNDSDGSKKKHNHTSSFLSPTSHSKVTQNLFISMPDSFELSGIAFKVEIDMEFATEVQQQTSECFERHNRPVHKSVQTLQQYKIVLSMIANQCTTSTTNAPHSHGSRSKHAPQSSQSQSAANRKRHKMKLKNRHKSTWT